jgi:hypothetical protein
LGLDKRIELWDTMTNIYIYLNRQIDIKKVDKELNKIGKENILRRIINYIKKVDKELSKIVFIVI